MVMLRLFSLRCVFLHLTSKATPSDHQFKQTTKWSQSSATRVFSGKCSLGNGSCIFSHVPGNENVWRMFAFCFTWPKSWNTTENAQKESSCFWTLQKRKLSEWQQSSRKGKPKTDVTSHPHSTSHLLLQSYCLVKMPQKHKDTSDHKVRDPYFANEKSTKWHFPRGWSFYVPRKNPEP